MASPTRMPYTSFSCTRFDVVTRKAVSGRKSPVSFKVIRYLAFLGLVGAASFITALPKLHKPIAVNKSIQWVSNTAWLDLAAENQRQDQQLTSIFPIAATQVPSCRGKCLDPHPGQFRFWYGQQNGCWIQVWRGWPEGCQHYQWFNSCNGAWDVYPNGAPHVYWTCCVH